MAPPIKLTPELQEKIRLAVAAGNYLETAAAFAGVSKQTLYNWLRKGQRSKSNGPYKAFAEAMEQAMAQAETAGIAAITKAGESQWQALAWRLERRYPHKWGRRQRMDIDLTGDQKPDAATDEASALAKAEAIVARHQRRSAGTGDAGEG